MQGKFIFVDDETEEPYEIEVAPFLFNLEKG